jgi:hypothetical protein
MIPKNELTHPYLSAQCYHFVRAGSSPHTFSHVGARNSRDDTLLDRSPALKKPSAPHHSSSSPSAQLASWLTT